MLGDSMLGSTFGMCEMEEAASIFVKEAIRLKTPLKSVHVNVGGHMSELEIVGMCQLAANGWIKPIYPNSWFVPTAGMVRRIKQRHPECLRHEKVRKHIH